MSEVNAGNVAPQPSQQAGAAPTQQPTTQPSTPSIDPNEYARLQRIAEQHKGSQAYYNAGAKYGFKSEADFSRVGGHLKALESKGLSLDRLVSALEVQTQDSGQEIESLTKAQIEEMIGQRVTKAQADYIRQEAEKSHNQALDNEIGGLAPNKLKAALGDDLDDSLAELMSDALQGRYYNSRQPYAEGHPLHGGFAPLGNEGLTKLYDQGKAYLTKLKAQATLNLGAAARKPAASTPAGNGGNQGVASKNSPDGQDAIADKMKAAIAAKAKQIGANG